MYDRVVDVPRLICTVDPRERPVDDPVRLIHASLEAALGLQFGVVGLNYYRSGADSVAWHRDRIGRSGTPMTVALVSLGSPRTLAVRPHTDHPSRTSSTTSTSPVSAHRWALGHGDLLVMSGACQRDWEHCVPKERCVGPRISLAFRCKEAIKGPRIDRAGVPPL